MKKEKRKKEEFTTEKQEEDTSYLRYAVTEEGETERAFLHTKAKTFESAPKSDSHFFLPNETKNFHISAKKCQSPFLQKPFSTPAARFLGYSSRDAKGRGEKRQGLVFVRSVMRYIYD